ncbi:MAG TPA: hypothetical protein VNJ51_07315 [Candidatus Dormibacteraeota bacterium]|nr:hypothetical protein [Candidatus Dormibacteraeota bacterium]
MRGGATRAWLGRLPALLAGVALALSLAGCRDIRVRTYAQGYSFVPASGPEIAVVRDRRAMAALGIDLKGIDYRHVFAVALLMGPHRHEGYHQVIASIKANDTRVRVVAFEEAPPRPGVARPNRTYTVWIIPNLVYRSGAQVQAVTPDGALMAATTLP